MPLNFYKANEKKLGMLSSWSFNSKEECVYAGFKKQTGYDQDTGIAAFKDGASIKVKFSKEEIGAIISVIERLKDKYIFKHQSPDFLTLISFKASFDNNDLRGFCISIKRDNSNFRAGYSIKDSIILREFLKFSLTHIFTAIYSLDKKEALERQKENFIKEETSLPKENPPKEKKTKSKSKKEEPEDDDVDLDSPAPEFDFPSEDNNESEPGEEIF
ncbi:MAG: hypothetical protein AABY22_22915 [Nanoarchaeota archaeon]